MVTIFVAMQHLYLEHRTLCPTVAGYMDSVRPAKLSDGVAGSTSSLWQIDLVGWAFRLTDAGRRAPIRYRDAQSSTTLAMEPVRRDDVAAAYHRTASLTWCGWNQSVYSYRNVVDHDDDDVAAAVFGALEMQAADGSWTRFMEIPAPVSARRAHLQRLCDQSSLHKDHAAFLWKLRNEHGFVPKVAYDLGSHVLAWTKAAARVWPDAEFVLFDGYAPAAFLYRGYKHYHVGVLSDVDGRVVRFYQNDDIPSGNSYYREIGCDGGKHFPTDRYVEATCRTLDSVVAERGFPPPDLIKIDVQGCEMDILRGALSTLASAQYLIVELQDTNYNDGAPKADVVRPFIESLGWTCVAAKFSDNGPDADYCFKRNSTA